MGHVGKEYALSLICPFGLGKRIFQQIISFHFFTDFLIHTVKSQNHSMIFFPFASAHNTHLVILHFAVL